MIERYQTDAMTAIWSEHAKFKRWTRVELAATEAFFHQGEVPEDEIEAIRTKHRAPAPARVKEIEAETNHDVVAFVRALSESIGEPACRHLHRGLTSSDVVDTANALALCESLDIIISATVALRDAVNKRAIEHKYTPCAGRTHGVHAEPTTFGLRLAGWSSELNRHIDRLRDSREHIAYAKLSGAVGTFSQTDPKFEAFVVKQLGLKPEPIATQVVPRDRHAQVLGHLALLGAGLERFATEIRSLQRTDLREAEEYFARGQTGSSAMPHKRNPITSERISGMARLLRGYMISAYENVALWHDRDISHSSVERVIFPDAFHCTHYMLERFSALISNLLVYPERMLENMNRTKGLLFSQNVLGCLLEAGMERQAAYKIVQRCAMAVWADEQSDLRTAIAAEPAVQAKLTGEDLAQAFELAPYFKHIDTLFARAEIRDES